ncbi:phospholipase/carboxylesterase [Bradyrhizobium sp. GM2.2]|jgi:phospholipase/carboxylesterase|uniref:Hydrolase n=1 Tax=Bradyrhizobium canariense TaxID=255045 RepID=A0A1X3FA57_9BRAD|nr:MULTISPECIES: alpha/beta hydrolase [Bradyrhizobium]MCK1272275.1 alpha/beta hydrolase [Bradyrhizobium sp. 84]MCK1291127.1 alpha/beta hydrolase [Bradyrhizobium sp. 30]MCK1318184.1 alpha/beta hydrolase [Bradyrhizobium sp. 23]MCK1324124.1 alpha/beta hydrolase [Bradyrhizobium sp. 156]MCK1330767.1 alpha/beta hydrolase [Bradyrhizobium sp. CW9]MCK1355667.1 alpha/beta hydrolase [Bradyrhizobium sp. CW7]MCK1372318.1 alpha/beta hydrolase [Bradyrhizobium sp. 49]MCK1418769.1 alpha/beta hydrolase [Brad
MTESSFIHRFEPARDAGSPPLLLLHGTGGDENDLLGLGKMISPGSALLSPRGRVLEHGMPRFFRRLTEGVFDEDDVRRRALELGDFVAEARQRYGLAAPVAVGFSNGANIAAALLLLKPDALAGAILLRAMVPLSDPPKVNLAGKPILLLSGQADPIVPASNSARLASLLSEAGAQVGHKVLPAGHQLSQADLTLARDWIGKFAAEVA